MVEGGKQNKHSYKFSQAERDGRTQAAHFRAAPFPLLACLLGRRSGLT